MSDSLPSFAPASSQMTTDGGDDGGPAQSASVTMSTTLKGLEMVTEHYTIEVKGRTQDGAGLTIAHTHSTRTGTPRSTQSPSTIRTHRQHRRRSLETPTGGFRNCSLGEVVPPGSTSGPNRDLLTLAARSTAAASRESRSATPGMLFELLRCVKNRGHFLTC